MSRIPKPAGNVGRSFGDSNKKSILAHGLDLKGQEVRSGGSLGSKESAGSTPQPVACGCLDRLLLLPIAQLVNLVLAWPSS